MVLGVLLLLVCSVFFSLSSHQSAHNVPISLGLLKKRKKAKLEATAKTSAPSTASTDGPLETVVKKVAESPDTPVVAAVLAVAVGTVATASG